MWSLGAAHELPPFDVIFLGEPEAAPPASLLLLITWCVTNNGSVSCKGSRYVIACQS